MAVIVERSSRPDVVSCESSSVPEFAELSLSSDQADKLLGVSMWAENQFPGIDHADVMIEVYRVASQRGLSGELLDLEFSAVLRDSLHNVKRRARSESGQIFDDETGEWRLPRSNNWNAYVDCLPSASAPSAREAVDSLPSRVCGFPISGRFAPSSGVWSMERGRGDRAKSTESGDLAIYPSTNLESERLASEAVAIESLIVSNRLARRWYTAHLDD